MRFLNFYFLLFLLFVAVSCGKVTQITPPEKPAKSFALQYAVPVLTTENYKISVAKSPQWPSQNAFTVLHTEVFGRVMGIDVKGKRQDLSWGKVVLERFDETVSTSSSTLKSKFSGGPYYSHAYRKGGVEIDNTDYRWTYGQVTNKPLAWSFKSSDVAVGYPYYWVSVFASDKVVRHVILTQAQVSGNKSLDVGTMDEYRSFIAVLFLIELEGAPDLNGIATPPQLSQLFTPPFFELLNYSLPPNKVQKFSSEQPVFVYGGTLESQLLNIMHLVMNGEKEEALHLLKKMDKKLMSDSAKSILESSIKRSSAVES